MDAGSDIDRRTGAGAGPLLGRSAELEILRARLDGSSAWVGLDLRGRYGTGRTAVATWFADAAVGRNWASARLDGSPRNLAVALGELVEDIPSRRSFGIWRRRRAFRRQQRRWLEIFDGLPEASGDLTQAATELVGSGASFIASPVAGAAVGIVSTGAREIAAQSRGAGDVRLHTDAERELTALFLDVVAAAAKRHDGIVVVLEDVEERHVISTEWLRSIVDGAYGDLPANAVIVATSVRGLPVERWKKGSANGRWQVISLEPFDRRQSAEYLRSRGITNEATIDALHDRADGIVGRLDRFASVELGARAEDVIDWSLLKGREGLARRASVPRRFDRDVLAVVVDPAPDDEAWRWLKGCGDMTLHRDGHWLILNDYRQLLLAQLRAESPDSYRAAHAALADWYGTTGSARRGALGEAAYHAVAADGVTGLGSALATCDARFDIDQLHQVTDAVAAAAAEIGDHELDSAAMELERVITSAGLEEWSDVADALQELRRPAFDDARLVGRIAGWRARALELADVPVSALAELDQAVAADPDEPVHRVARVSLHFDQGRYKDALADLDVLVSDDPDDRGRRMMRTVCRLLTQASDGAVEDATAILNRSPADVEALSIRAMAHQSAGNAEAAIADAARLVGLEPDVAARKLLFAQIRVMNGDLGAIDEYSTLADAQASELARQIHKMRMELSADAFEQFVTSWTRSLGMPTSTVRRLFVDDPGPDVFEAMMRAEAAVQRGQLLSSTDRPNEALEAFDAALDLDGENLGIHVLRAVAAMKVCSADKMVSDLDGPDAPPWEPGRLVQRAVAFQQLGRTPEARAALDAAIEMRPQSPELPRVSCNLRLADGDRDGAVADLERVLELDPTRWQDWCLLAWLLMQNEDVERFADVVEHLAGNASVVIPFLVRRSLAADDPSQAGFGALLRKDPVGTLHSLEVTGPVLRAEMRWKKGQRQDALVDLRAAVERWPEQPGPWEALSRLLTEAPDAGLPHRKEPTGSVDRVWEALVLDRREEREAALRLLAHGFSGPPLVPYGYLLRSMLRVRAEDNDGALRDLADGLATTNGAAFLRHARARLYSRLDRPEDALADYDALIEGGGGLNADVRYERGELLRKLGRFPEALVDLSAADALGPSNATIIGTAGQVLYAMNDVSGAIKVFDRALTLDPSLDWALHERAGALVTAGRLDRARSDVQLLVERSPGPKTRFTEGLLALASDRPEDAVSVFEQLIDEQLIDELPNGDFLVVNLVSALRRAGRADDAIAAGRAVSEDERSEELRMEMAQAALAAGHAQDAERQFRQLAEAESGTPFACYETSRALRHLGRLEEADMWTRRALEAELSALEDETVAFVRSLRLCNVGLYHAALCDPTAARTAYQQAIEESAEPANIRHARSELEELRAAGGDAVIVDELLVTVEL